MIYHIDKTNCESETTDTTGEHAIMETKTIIYPLGPYEITIELSPDDQFIGITRIRLNKDFLSYKQKTMPKGYHDVEEFYSK